MDKRGIAICLFLILRLGLLLPVTSGENCPVNPDCSCSGSVVQCNPMCGPNVPKLAASSKQFSEVKISGNMDINQILPGTFQNLSTREMYIQNTGITDIDCDAFNGITRRLKTLDLSYNSIEAVPSCSFLHVEGISELHLTSNHISNLTKNAFRQASQLVSLSLDWNEIETIEIGSFNNLDALENLNLDKNKISYFEGSLFDNLSSLRSLEMRRNTIKMIHPKSFDRLESLTYLGLNGNEISSLDGTTFEHLINIDAIGLRSNLISFLPEKIFAKLAKLSYLDVGDNQLVFVPDNIFQKTPWLRYLFIQQNNLSSISPRLFSSTPNLKSLSIYANRIVNLDPEIFKDCYKLEYIDAKNNEIKDLQPGSFRNLSSLQYLDLSANYLTEIRAGVFDNSTSLGSLNLGANRISFIENSSLASQQKSLKWLFLHSNRLSNKSWVTLQPILIELENLLDLDLSHNPIGDLPTPVIDSFNYLENLRLRNCSLSYILVNKTNLEIMDLSANSLNKITDLVLSKTYDPSLNVSYNNIQSIALRILSNRFDSLSPTLDAQHNEIENVDIFINSDFPNIEVLQFSYNLISTSLCLKTSTFYLLDLGSLDLSHNKLNNVTKYPIRLNSSVSIYSNQYLGIKIRSLNLSRNNISFVSPEAFLGRITDLDLSHNRIQVLGRLLPANASSSDFRTQHLDLSGNFIHQISSDVFSGHENIVNNINLAQNSLTEVQTLRNVLEEEGFQRLYLSDNPLVCDCESFWLRQDPVASKLDSARCETPANAKSFLSFCYQLENCFQIQKLNMSTSDLDVCKNDIHMIIDNLQFTTLDTVGNSVSVNVTWARHGPGQITGYKLEITPSLTTEKLMTSLVHPAAVNYILSGIQIEMTYNVCISAQREQVTVTEVMCKSLQVEATDDNIIISKSILIGISSALGLCAMCIVLLLFGYIIRLKKTRSNCQRDSTCKSPTSGRFEGTQQSLADNNLNPTATPINQANSRNPQNTGSYLTDQGHNSNLVNRSEMYVHPVNRREMYVHPVNRREIYVDPVNRREMYQHPVNLTDEVDNSDIYETVQNVANVTD